MPRTSPQHQGRRGRREGLDWKTIGTASGRRDAAGNVIGVFGKAPDWLKAAVATGWGLNKLTGGAVIDFGKLVLGRGASPFTPMYVHVVNPTARTSDRPDDRPDGGTGSSNESKNKPSKSQGGTGSSGSEGKPGRTKPGARPGVKPGVKPGGPAEPVRSYPIS